MLLPCPYPIDNICRSTLLSFYLPFFLNSQSLLNRYMDPCDVLQSSELLLEDTKYGDERF